MELKLEKDWIESQATKIIRNLALQRGLDPVKIMAVEKALFWDICLAIQFGMLRGYNFRESEKMESAFERSEKIKSWSVRCPLTLRRT